MFAALTLVTPAYDKPVSALAVYDGCVYVGRTDGAVERLDASLSVQGKYSSPGGAGVSFVAASPYGVAWLQGPGGAIREKVTPPKPAPQILNVRQGDRVFQAQINPSTPVRRLAWLQGRVAICYDFGTSFYDSKAHQVDASAFMPADVADLVRGSSLFVREQEDGTEFAVFARPYSVRRDPRNQKAPLVSLFSAYQVGAWQWARLGGFASNAFDAFPEGELKATEEGKLTGEGKFLVLSDRLALAQDGVVAREPDSIVNAPLFVSNWEIARAPSSTVPGDALWTGAGGGSLWWWTGAVLAWQNRRDGSAAAYLPWSGVAPTAFAADGAGLWVGSAAGLRYLDPARPDATGFAGFVRAPFGNDATPGPDANAKKLTDAVFAWRFADADKAGADGGMMVASIFSALGLQLPQTAAELMSSGAPVTDELRFGDVIATSRSAAIYLGNGITVEVRNGRVQNGDIWGVSKASVRRFSL